MLFKRYSDVSFLLSSMYLDELYSFLLFMFEETNNEELWNVWINNPLREGSFEDFKNEVMEQAKEKQKTKEQIEREANEAKEKALASLDRFGGEPFGD